MSGMYSPALLRILFSAAELGTDSLEVEVVEFHLDGWLCRSIISQCLTV